MPPRRAARDPSDERRRRDTDRAKKWRELQRNAGTELDAVGTGLPAQQTKVRVRKVARNDSTTRVERHDAERMQKLDGQDSYLERVSWLSAFDEDRAGQWMSARTSLGDLELDGLQRLWDLGLGSSGQSHSLQPACNHGLDPHAIA